MTLKNNYPLAAIALLIAALSACNPVETEDTPPTPINETDYTGPTTKSDLIQSYQREVWKTLRKNSYCGACHGLGGQSPQFVRDDDIDIAYNAIMPFIDLATPGNSALVSKIAAGHNCWQTSASACADELTGYLERWIFGDNSPLRSVDIQLDPLDEAALNPPNTDFVSFPSDSNAFQNTVWPLLTQYCGDCHADSATIRQTPFFSNADVISAYEAAKPKINLNRPADSRLVLRLREEFHNCWGDCQANAQTMEDQIQALANLAQSQGSDNQLDLNEMVTSKAFTIADAVVASGNGRHESNLIARYEFKSGSANIIYDTSGVGQPLNLTISGIEGVDYRWQGSWGVEFISADAHARGVTNSQKIHDTIKTSGAYSIEAWLIPANVTQEGPARIVSYSGSNDSRNFTLGQTLYNYDFLNRSSTTDGNGLPALSTPNADEVLQASQQHVVATYDGITGRRLYVNGELVASNDPEAGGSLIDWDPSFALLLGNEASMEFPWQGTMRFVAIHSRALTAEQVRVNNDAGVGERYYLLFNISDVVALSQSYILFEVMQFDNYSYLFNRPTFIRLGDEVQASDIPSAGIALAGLRIGINGKEAEIGQAYSRLNTTLSAQSYSAQGQVLSSMGTILAIENGPQEDEFFLTFDNLNGQLDQRTTSTQIQPFPAFSGEQVADIGLRTFDEINATMAAITGVDASSPDISGANGTYTLVKQQLPSVESIDGFLSAHQIGVAQLAIEYCNALVEDTGLRNTFFPGFNFNANANSIADTAWDNGVITPLIRNVVGTNLLSQPDEADIRTELSRLILNPLDQKPINAPDGIPDGLAKCGGSCPTGRTETVVKATCAALLGSATMLLQ